MQIILSRSRIQIVEGVHTPEAILLHLSSPPVEGAIVIVKLQISSNRVVLSPPGPYIFSANNASTPVAIYFSAVGDDGDHIDVERLVGFFNLSDTDPRLYLRRLHGQWQCQGIPNMSQFDWNSTQSKSWNHTEKEKGEDYVDFSSRLIVNFTLLVVDNDDSGLVVPRHSQFNPWRP